MMPFLYQEPNVINVFTDASTSNEKDKQNLNVGAGFLVVNNGVCIDSDVKLLFKTTSSFGELYAMFMGVSAIYRDTYIKRCVYHMEPAQYYVYNLFSDSKYALDSIRKWIFDWLYNTNRKFKYKNGQLCHIDDYPVLKKTDGYVKNQECILHAMMTVISANVPINFYHIKSHLNPTNENHVDRAISCFVQNNPHVQGPIPFTCIADMVKWNNEIDTLTRDVLKSSGEPDYQYITKTKWPVTTAYPTISQQQQYRSLVQ